MIISHLYQRLSLVLAFLFEWGIVGWPPMVFLVHVIQKIPFKHTGTVEELLLVTMLVIASKCPLTKIFNALC